MYNLFSFILTFIICLCLSCCTLGENCPGPIYEEWCPAKPNHILCAPNDYKSRVNESDVNLIEMYSNYFKRNTICNEINNETFGLALDKYLIKMAIKGLGSDLWHQDDVCFATKYYSNVRLIHYYPLNSNTVSIDDLTSVMNIRALGCANNSTNLLCLFSDDNPFKNLQKYVAHDSRHCGLYYDKFNSDVCYLTDTTANTIIEQLNKFKTIRWDDELEYLAQGSIASNTTNLCYTKDQRQIKLSPINYHADQISKFTTKNVIELMIRNGVFDVLNDSDNYTLGCTFYDIQAKSLRVLCIYDKYLENGDIMGIIETMASSNVYVTYGLIILVHANILIILICLRIVCKFRLPTDDEIYSSQPIYSTPQ